MFPFRQSALQDLLGFPLSYPFFREEVNEKQLRFHFPGGKKYAKIQEESSFLKNWNAAGRERVCRQGGYL